MDPLIGGLITGGASLLGSIFGSNTSASNTQAMIEANQQNIQQQEQFQQTMSNTAYQRASTDMKAAGLNPAMMFGSGSAASTPGGAGGVPTISRTSPFANLGDAVGKSVSTAVQMKTMDKMADEMANLEAENAKIKEETKSIPVQRSKTAEETGLTEAETRKIKALMPQVENASRTAANQLAMPRWLRDTIDQSSYVGERASQTLRPATDVISSAKGVRSLFSDRYGNW